MCTHVGGCRSNYRLVVASVASRDSGLIQGKDDGELRCILAKDCSAAE